MYEVMGSLNKEITLQFTMSNRYKAGLPQYLCIYEPSLLLFSATELRGESILPNSVLKINLQVLIDTSRSCF